jgi:urea transport system substrate-binding protein
MGVVYKARQLAANRLVALKMILAGSHAGEADLARFRTEAEALARLQHPNIVQVHEVGEHEGKPFFSLEFCPSGPLDHKLDGTPWQPQEAARLVETLARAMHAAHEKNVIHRDLKPANVLLDEKGQPRITDFGLAKKMDEKGQTASGVILGTPSYMAPEQAAGKEVGPATDIYALGAILYELLTGRPPFKAATPLDTVMQVLHEEPQRPRKLNPRIDPDLEAICLKCLSREADRRYPCALALADDLGRFLNDESIQARPVSRAERFWRWCRRKPLGVGLGVAVLLLVALPLVLERRLLGPEETGTPPGITSGPSGADDLLRPPGERDRKDPVKVGVLHSLSGTMANSEGPVVDAVLFAIEEVNQAGGVLGRPVKAVVADGRSEERVFLREAQRLLEEEKVCTVFGCWTSASRKTVRPVFEAHGNLLIYPVQFEGLETSPNIVYLGAAPNQQLLPAARWAVTSLHKKRFFLVGSDSVFPRAAHTILKDDLKRAGAEVVGEAYVPLGCQKVEAAVAALVRAKPDMVLNTIYGDTNLAFFRALRGAGITPANIPVLSFSISAEGLRTLDAGDRAGDYTAWTYYQSVATPENEAFVRRFHEKHPEHSISDPMETAYVGVKLWAQAVNEAKSLEPKKIRRAMLNHRLKGPGGEVWIDPETQYGSRTPRVGRSQADGTFKVIWSAPAPVRPQPYPDTRTVEEWRAFLRDLYTGWGDRWEAPRTELPKGKTK